MQGQIWWYRWFRWFSPIFGSDRRSLRSNLKKASFQRSKRNAREKAWPTASKTYHQQVVLLPNPGGAVVISSNYKKARIFIFFYEDTEGKDGNQKYGGRSRNVLSDFIGDAKLKSLQSDGYNVYTYLDDELVDIDHLDTTPDLTPFFAPDSKFPQYFKETVVWPMHGLSDR